MTRSRLTFFETKWLSVILRSMRWCYVLSFARGSNARNGIRSVGRRYVIRNRAIGSVMVIMSPTAKRGAATATLGAHTTDTSAGWGNLFVGAPLDFVKLVAAIAMTGGHINASLFNGDYLLLWRLDRIPFPLFCFVIACNLLRGTPTPRYVQMLLLLGIATQPIYALVLPPYLANVLSMRGILAATQK